MRGVHARDVTVWTVCAASITVLLLIAYENSFRVSVSFGVFSRKAHTSAFSYADQHDFLVTRHRHWFLETPAALCARHELPARERMSSPPFISGDTFRSMADYVYDDTSDPRGASWVAADVRLGDVIFVKTDYLREFFSQRHVNVNNSYILITHNSDLSVPTDKRGPCQSECEKYLEDDKLGHWYGQNMLEGHLKTTPIPIGIANRMWPHGDVERLLSIAKAAPAWSRRGTNLYVGVRLRNRKRKEVVSHLTHIPGVKVVRERVSHEAYLQDMANAKFVAAPPGFGIDTHRAWEAIYLGAVPIIQRGALDALFAGMTVLLVDDFRNVTAKLLEEFTAKHQHLPFRTHKAWANYWEHDLEKRRQQVQAGNWFGMEGLGDTPILLNRC